MSHSIFQSNENSPYGDLTREEFYKHHKIMHRQSFMLNKQNTRIFIQPWPCGHGSCYTSESSWLFELNAVAMTKAGFFICSTGYIPSIQPLVQDCIQYFDSARADHPKLPAILYGESLGGAIATLLCVRQESVWNGLILIPSWRIVITKPPASISQKEGWKRKMISKSLNRLALEKNEHIQRISHELQVPLLILQGGEDKVCDPEAAKLVYESAGSKDKTMKISPGMSHQLISEPNETVQLVFNAMLSWLEVRADLSKI
ncbi:unnamed protein product [Withania somnifera]